ncbi:MAG: hypothetical protein PHU27_07405, partial [Salinivirgaceae bacterium]|nr:hypothetical protein [Salinivirgaceae bacterium]
MKLNIKIIAILLLTMPLFTKAQNGGKNIEITFTNGKSHNHPTFAIWLETMEGKFVQPLFVTQSLAT